MAIKYARDGGEVQRPGAGGEGDHQFGNAAVARDGKLDQHPALAPQAGAFRVDRQPVALHGGQNPDQVGLEIHAHRVAE